MSYLMCARANKQHQNTRLIRPPLPSRMRGLNATSSQKVDELMALCDSLEVTSVDDTRHQLLGALLAEALTPDDARELEAAE
jgi:hypothetical protein